MASAAEGSLGTWPCVEGLLRVPARLEAERGFGSCILTHLGQLLSVLELCSKCLGARSISVCEVTALE